MTNFQRIVKYCAIGLAFLIIIGFVGALISGIDFLSSFLKNNTKNLTNSMEIEIAENITKLKIDLSATDLIIESAEKLHANTNNDKINYYVQGNTLIITEENNKIFTNSGNLTIYIPKNYIFEKISLEAGAGKIEFNDVTVQELDLNLGAGSVELSNLNIIKETSIDGGAGTLTIENSILNNLELDMGLGDLKLTSELIGKNEISCGIGNVDINLIGDNYKIQVDKALGPITIAGQSMQDKEIYGTGNNRLEVDGGVGSITINFLIE